MMAEEEKSTKDDECLRLLLEEAGLESVPIDPTSLEALRELVANSTDEFDVRVNMDVEMKQKQNHDNHMYDKDQHPQGYPPAAAIQFVPMEGASPVENKILEQLHQQTQLLVNMQARIDELTATVEHLTNQSGSSSSSSARPTTFSTGIPSRRTTARAAYSATTAPPKNVPFNRTAPTPTTSNASKTPPQQRTPPPPAAPRQQQNEPPAAAAAPGGLLMAIRHSRIFQIISLFLALRGRHVQELDGGLIFKILFMMAILTARMSGSKKYGDPEWHIKFACLVTLVVFAFLVQTGHIKYAYTFIVKENYPARIWNGQETIEDILQNSNAIPRARPGQAPAAPRHAPPHPLNNNGNAPPRAPPPPPQQQGWRNTFLGGMIPEANQGGALGAVQDVALLFGSFLMSIFPMWHPEGPPRRPPPPEAVQEQLLDQAGMAAPGAVQPPRDAFQAADDDDDEERDDQQDNNNLQE